MTTEEFSNEFDVLLNSYSIPTEYGKANNIVSLDLNEYDKSVFLTQAQEAIIIELYNGKNIFRDSFEKTEEMRRYLSSLIMTYTSSDKVTGILGVSKNSVFFNLPDDLWFITYESAVFDDPRLGCLNKEEAVIVPVSQDDYFRVSNNPFRGPGKKRALRLDIKDNVVEIVSEYNISKYLVRYLSRLSPIILAELPDGLSIGGISTITECKLSSALHRIILERAVKYALMSRLPGAGTQKEQNV